MRLLAHNLYRVFQVTTACCKTIGSPEKVDPVVVMLNFASQITDDPLLSQFVKAYALTSNGFEPTIADSTYVPLTNSADIDAAMASLQISIYYRDTIFSDCSFDPIDHYEIEPVILTSAQLINDAGAPCLEQWTFTEIRAPVVAQGTGDQVLRDYILSLSYRQEFYPKNPRLREALDLHLAAGHVVRNPSVGYINYYILHSVPRKSNPTGVYDRDQYLIQLSVTEDTTVNFFESWMQSYLASAGNGIVMEDLSGTV